MQAHLGLSGGCPRREGGKGCKRKNEMVRHSLWLRLGYLKHAQVVTS
jgi:hypothetical protein